MFTDTRWSDTLFLVPASGGVVPAAAFLETLATTVSGWCALRGRVSISIRRRDHLTRIGSRTW